MSSNLELRDGWLWPADDTECFSACMREVKDIPRILEYVENKGFCVQAGGNCGVFPQELSKHFDKVYTFEPDILNFRCLAQNIKALNVFEFNAVLGYGHESVGLSRDMKNVGAHYVGGPGMIPTFQIDDLDLWDCSLIYLDIEGYEHHALYGGKKTIRKFSPVVVLECKGLGARYGNADDAVTYLQELGNYKEVERIGRDIIFKC